MTEADTETAGEDDHDPDKCMLCSLGRPCAVAEAARTLTTDPDTNAIKRRVEAWSNSKQGYRERGESNHAPWRYDISAMRTAGNALVGAVETLLTALDAAERENQRLREARHAVWVSVWKHGPMKVFATKDEALAWNVVRPRALTWDEVTPTDLHGYVEGKRMVQVHRRALTTPPAPEDAP